MTAQIAWGIADLEHYAANGQVFTAHWTVSATDGPYNAHAYGSVALEPPGDDMVPYEELTPERVLSWVKLQLDEQTEELERSLLAQIAAKRSEPKASGLPW